MDKESALSEAFRRYFAQPGFSRFLAELRKRHEASQLGARGYVTLYDLSEQERITLDGFYGTYTTADQLSAKRYSVAKFARLLLESRFALTIPQLFQLLEGESPMTRGERRAAADMEWNELIDEALACGNFTRSAYHERVTEWTESLRHEQTSGARILRKLFAGSRVAASECLWQCLQALMMLADAHVQARSADQPAALPIRLPVLAAHATGDAHALDWKFPAGRLFWSAITEIYGEDIYYDRHHEAMEIMEVKEAEATVTDNMPRAILIREGYRCAGVADDDVSSQVMLFAPGWLQSWEERILTLRQVERISAEDLKEIRPSAIYAVENPSVFAVLVDQAASLNHAARSSNTVGAHEANKLPVLICVNGQPSVAVIRMLELLCEGDTNLPLYYSGDLDVKGLDIAQGLQQRFKPYFHPWRMDKEQYQRYSNRGIPLTESERERIKLTVYPWDECLSLEMASAGAKLHQELWVQELAADWIKTFHHFD
ncbi:TIGR02679 domain-containing protein [Paenibacillus alkaliterrae]|uniref:TIGR02679 domain-containing protein n=1 Tax=Paenibacillus alkaliterrae TaxID=320909 RepID=UPI001F3735DA|nr:TIGR02679 domain-containing protein [Paenibacillus alkaliterrae]